MSGTRSRHGAPDWWLLGITIVLTAFGLLMVYSASGIVAEKNMADTYYFFKRQMLFAAVGGIALAVAAGVSRETLNRLHYPFLFGSFILLIVTLSPLGVKVNGAQRWIGFGPFRLQSMEFAKLALVLYLGWFMAGKQAIIKTFSGGVIPPFLVTGTLCLLLLVQPDFGGAVLLSSLLFFMCLVGGTRFLYLFISACLAGCAVYLLITNADYRMSRLLAFLDPWAVAQGAGYQLVQGLLALGSGGLSGLGLGAGRQKLFYLPEAHNDFIMAVIGEEAGFIGVSLVILLCGVFIWRGMRIALRQDDLRDRLTAFGLILVPGLSILLNLAVVFGCAPPKGVPMPFFSYGGSSLMASLSCVGLLLNYSRTAKA